MRPYYEHAGIVIYQGDCRDVLPAIEAADVLITDPPYSDHVHRKQWIGHALTESGDKRCGTAFKELGFDALTDAMRGFVASEAARSVRRWSLFFCDIEGIAGWRADVLGCGLEYVRTMIWDKVDGAPQFTGDRPANGAEAIVCAHPSGKKQWNGGGSRNILRYAVNAERGAKPHPSTKPLPLMVELVGLFSNAGELVLDPFMGSGSTIEACKRLGRRAIGIEIEERYCEIAAKRLAQEVLFGTVHAQDVAAQR